MKKLLIFFLTIFALCSLSAQKPVPIQIETVNDSQYVVQYVPIATAQKNVSAQQVQVNKQLETTEKQITELIKKRDDLKRQQMALDFAAAQLDQAAAAPPTAAKSAAKTPTPATTPPATEKKATPKKKATTKKKPKAKQ